MLYLNVAFIKRLHVTVSGEGVEKFHDRMIEHYLYKFMKYVTR